MTKYLYIFLLFLTFALNAQITTESHILNVGFTPSGTEHKFQITFDNTSDTIVYLHWILTKNGRSWVDCWDTNFCDINLCYADNVDSSAFENEIRPGEFVFELGVKDNNCDGSTVIGLQLFTDETFQNEVLCMKININDAVDDSDFCTSSTKNDVFSDVRVYPNPVSDYINVEGENIKTIEVYNLMGSPVQKIDFSEKRTFDISAWNSGIYIMKLTSNKNETRAFKFIKQ
jgi:hypothetical protein